VVDPGDDYDAATWRAGALAALRSIAARGRSAIVCGGTGLYVRSLVRGLFRGPSADASLRARLRAEERASPGTLRERLRAVDPAAAARIHANDEVRTVRALEVHALTGRPISAWHAEHALGERPFATLTLEVSVDREELARRIDERSRAIVEAGIVEELESLRGRYPHDAKAFDAIGYREAARCLDGALARAGLADAIGAATRAYAKRQRVWLRRQEGALAIAPDAHDAAVARAAAFLDGVANREGIG
jgi:tRNA dimethylallyltransferase